MDKNDRSQVAFETLETHWLECTSLTDASTAYVPVGLFLPHYRHSPLAGDQWIYPKGRVVTSNGGASGSTRDEATLHALNEHIERHAQGAFAFETFLANDREVTSIRPESLSPSLQRLILEAQAVAMEEVHLFRMPDSFGIPVFYATARQASSEIQVGGAGASLFIEYAAERAVLELLQCLHIQKSPAFRPTFVTKMKSRLDALSASPRLQGALRNDVIGKIREGAVQQRRVDLLDREYFASDILKMAEGATGVPSVRDQIDRIVRALGNSGYSVYSTELYRSSRSEISCVKVHIPHLDNTWSLVNGMLVEPNEKCLQRFQKLRTAMAAAREHSHVATTSQQGA
jgi:ribosomal protein S12 methylthiotransferase accessory factor